MSTPKLQNDNVGNNDDDNAREDNNNNYLSLIKER